MANKKRLVIVGGVAAGMSAAAKARRLDPEMEIIAFERGRFVSYAACGLPWFICGMIPDHQRLIARTPEQFSQAGIEARTRHEVTRIDAQSQRVRVKDLDGGTEFDVPYNTLMIATGSQAIHPDLPGINLRGIFHLRTLEDGLAMREFIRAKQPKRAVIVGGGYIGLEVVECFKALDMETTVIDVAPRVLVTTFDADMAEIVYAELQRNGVTLSLSDGVQGFEGDEQVRAVVTEHGRFPADIVLLSMGIRANVSLAKEAGVAIGPTGAIAVDRHMRTNIPNVYSGGDCAEVYHLVKDRPAYIPLGSTANKQGRTAGANIAGADTVFAGVVGTAVSKVFGLEVARTGLTEEEAQANGFLVASTKISAHGIASYYPGAYSIDVKLIYGPENGQLLGAQIIGPGGAAKRIDVLATALHQRMTIDQVRSLDLSYAPPFAPVWDPILVAANVAAKD